jgi:hypothetical protein
MLHGRLQKLSRFVERFTATNQCAHYSFTVAARYYTHFVTATAQIPFQEDASEWSGVVELRRPLEPTGGTRELCTLLAQSFDLNSEDIKILHWARLH